MARRTKSRSGDSPNTILVVFLVLFILSNIGFGVWVYTLAGEKGNWDKEGFNKGKELEEVKKTKDFYQHWTNTLRIGVGDPEIVNKGDLVNAWRDKNKDAAVMFAGETEFNEYQSNVKLLTDMLGFDGTNYKTRFIELPDVPNKKLAVAMPELAKKTAEFKVRDAEYLGLQSKFDKEREKLLNTIRIGNDEALKARATANAQMNEALKQNAELRKEMEEKAEAALKDRNRLDKALKQLADQGKEKQEIEKAFRKELDNKEGVLLAMTEKIRALEAKVNNPDTQFFEGTGLVGNASERLVAKWRAGDREWDFRKDGYVLGTLGGAPLFLGPENTEAKGLQLKYRIDRDGTNQATITFTITDLQAKRQSSLQATLKFEDASRVRFTINGTAPELAGIAVMDNQILVKVRE